MNDNELLALLSGAWDGEAMRGRRVLIDAHLAECKSCRALVSAATPLDAQGEHAPHRLAKSAPAAEKLGRYSLLHPLGEGAMGIVYAAYDPELDRRVALKLLHASGSDAEALRRRLLAEAQAMARLQHPNVIAVHDVGTWGEQVFVAMEMVAGETLSVRLAKAKANQPGQWREILQLFIAAGRGLAAANAAGIVHRDFKPDNVLVGEDGRVRVTDFGLARSEARVFENVNSSTGDSNAKPPSNRAWQRIVNDARARLGVQRPSTQAGALIGSPPFMSPEQIRGEKVDARSDQFSFALALYASLYGEHPFGGENLRERLLEIEQGRVRSAPVGSAIPLWVRRIILRGLAANKSDRFPSLTSLLDALEKDPVVRWRRPVAVLSATAVIAAAALFARWQSDRNARVCLGAEAKLSGIWDGPMRARGQTAFAKANMAYANASWDLATRALDQYAAAWSAMRTEACEATAIKKQQTPQILDLRMACLDDRLRSLGAATELFANADKEVIARAASVVSGLPQLAGCADVAALLAPGAPPENLRPAIASIRGRLENARVRADAGKADIAEAKAIRDEAQRLGYAPLVAEALFSLGRTEHMAGEDVVATQTFIEATSAALSTRDDRTLANSWIALLNEYNFLGNNQLAEGAARQAQAAVKSLGEGAGEETALLVQLNRLAINQSQFKEAQGYSERAVALLEKEPANVESLIDALNSLAGALGEQANWERAVKAEERAFAMAQAHYGPLHPSTGLIEEQLGVMLDQSGSFLEAHQHLEHALKVLEDALGKNHPALADALNSLGGDSLESDPERSISYLQRALQIEIPEEGGEETRGAAYSLSLLGDAQQATRHYVEARASYERARAINLRLSGNPDDHERATNSTGLGAVLIELGDFKAARGVLEETLAGQRRSPEPEQVGPGDTEAALARLDLLEGRLAEARKLAEDALSIARNSIPGESTPAFERELLLAQISLAEGRPDRARISLERVLALPDADPPAPHYDRALARSLLAQSLWSDQRERPRALQLGQMALNDRSQRSFTHASDRAQLRRWLAARAK